MKPAYASCKFDLAAVVRYSRSARHILRYQKHQRRKEKQRKKGAIENLESILAVPGIDMVQFGPSDYSMSIGVTRQTAGERVREAEK